MSRENGNLRTPAAMSNGHGQKFSRVKELAVAALLSQPTVCSAAEHSGISERSLRRWLQTNSEFRQCYEERRRELLDATSNNLRSHAFDAVNVLVKLMQDDIISPSSRITAAKAVIELTLSASQVEQPSEIQMRLTALEESRGKHHWGNRNV